MRKIPPTAIKLIALGCVLSGTVCLSGAMAYRAVRQVRIGGPNYERIVQSKDLIADILPPPEYAIESYLTVLQLLQNNNALARHELELRVDKLIADYNDRHTYWEANLPEGATREALLKASYTPAKAFYDLIKDQFIPAIEAGDRAKAAALADGPIRQQYELHRAGIDEVVKSATIDAQRVEEDSAQTNTRSNYAFAALAAVLVLALAVVAALVTRVTAKLTGMARAIGQNADLISTVSSQVAQSSQSLAQGASEQAASLEESSSSLEEINSMTKKNADTAQQASLLSSESKSVSDKGNAAMAKMSGAITSIQQSASETAQIVKTIDEIAFQTNLLALNAAVEAARAGEAGKGFAVVAEEVRNLAIRSADAAKRTAALIEESVQNAKHGVVITNEVSHSLREITESTHKVNLLVSEIAAACQEQSTGVGQVNESVRQMDAVTQGNAAVAEQSAASAEELTTQSEQLRSIVVDLLILVRGECDAQPASPKTAPSRPKIEPAPTRTAMSIGGNTLTDSGDFSDFRIAA